MAAPRYDNIASRTRPTTGHVSRNAFDVSHNLANITKVIVVAFRCSSSSGSDSENDMQHSRPATLQRGISDHHCSPDGKSSKKLFRGGTPSPKVRKTRLRYGPFMRSVCLTPLPQEGNDRRGLMHQAGPHLNPKCLARGRSRGSNARSPCGIGAMLEEGDQATRPLRRPLGDKVGKFSVHEGNGVGGLVVTATAW